MRVKQPAKRTGRPPADPTARERHGATSRYERGCRCAECREAMAEHQRVRRARLRRGDGDFVVSAELAREHLLALQAAGVGKRAVQECTGIFYEEVARIRRGEKRRIRMSTEQKIMRVTADMRSDCAVIPADLTLRRIEELCGLGYTKALLARMLGRTDTSHFQLGRAGRVTARTEHRVERLYRELTSLTYREARSAPGITDRIVKMVELAAKVA